MKNTLICTILLLILSSCNLEIPLDGGPTYTHKSPYVVKKGGDSFAGINQGGLINVVLPLGYDGLEGTVIMLNDCYDPMAKEMSKLLGWSPFNLNQVTEATLAGKAPHRGESDRFGFKASVKIGYIDVYAYFYRNLKLDQTLYIGTIKTDQPFRYRLIDNHVTVSYSIEDYTGTWNTVTVPSHGLKNRYFLNPFVTKAPHVMHIILD